MVENLPIKLDWDVDRRKVQRVRFWASISRDSFFHQNIFPEFFAAHICEFIDSKFGVFFNLVVSFDVGQVVLKGQ